MIERSQFRKKVKYPPGIIIYVIGGSTEDKTERYSNKKTKKLVLNNKHD